LTHGTTTFASLVLPVCNGGPEFGRTLESVRSWLAARREPWELIVVDDGSTDGTGKIVAAFADEHRGESVSAIRLPRNRGKGLAVRTGLARARGRYVLFTDSDLAYPLDNLDRILDSLRAGADAAIACRVLPESTYHISPSFFSYLYTRHLMGRLFNRISRVLAVPRLLDTQAGLKGFRRDALHDLLGRLVLDGFSFDVELLRALQDRGRRIDEVPVSFRYDSEPTTVRFVRDAACMIRDLIRVRLRSWRGIYRGPEPEPVPARLDVVADDYGLSPGVNRAIEEALEQGAVTGASILLSGPHGAEALRWASLHDEHDFGAHLNLTLGRPVLPASEVPSLVTGDGKFPGLRRFLGRYVTGRIRLAEVRAEWEAQLATIRAAGVRLRRLDSHQHVHLLPGLFRDVVLLIAARERLAVRTMDGPTLRLRGVPSVRGVILAAMSRVASRGTPFDETRTHGFGTGLDRQPTLPVLRALVARLRPGRRYELVVHPGRVDEALLASGDGYVGGREVERRLLLSREGLSLLNPLTRAGRSEGATMLEEVGAPTAAGF
jgi:dolichyl-phosphate beta-glucosyltransferase